jgi:DNA-directed RNA polymerase subunit RPC12/RpoP
MLGCEVQPHGDTVPETRQHIEVPSPTSQPSPDPPIKLFLKLRYPSLTSPPTSVKKTAINRPTVLDPRITTLRSLTYLIINSLVFAATLVSKSGTPAAFLAARFLIDQVRQLGDTGNALQKSYSVFPGAKDGEEFTESLHKEFEAVFFYMAMLRHKLSDSAEGVKVAEGYEDVFHQLSEREEWMDSDTDDRFIPMVFSLKGIVNTPRSPSDGWPCLDDSEMTKGVNINNWPRLALLSIATFQFSAALAEALGATDDATFLAQQALCFEYIGESVRQYSSIDAESFQISTERARPYVFGVLAGMWEAYENYDDYSAPTAEEGIGYVELYEGLNVRLGVLNEQERFEDGVSGLESDREAGDASIEELDHMDISEASVDGDMMQETEDETSDMSMEISDDKVVPENASIDLEGNRKSELHEMPVEISAEQAMSDMEEMESVDPKKMTEVEVNDSVINDDLMLDAINMALADTKGSTSCYERQEEPGEAPMNGIDAGDAVHMAMSEAGGTNLGEVSDSDLSDMPVQDLETMIMIESDSNIRSSPQNHSNGDLVTTTQITFSHAQHFNTKGFRTDDKTLEYNECDKKYTAFKEHKQDIHSTSAKPHNCNDCDKGFWSRYELERHQLIHADEQFKYEERSKVFSQKTNLTKDQPKVHKRVQTCGECGASFTAKKHLDKNQRTVHDGEKSLECVECDRRLFSERIMNQHYRNRHSAERHFECTDCGKRFTLRKTLKAHQRSVHSSDNPFECDHCDSRFSASHNLRQHQIVHSVEKPFECSSCNNKYTSKRGLKDHQRVHSNEKKFECEDCGTKFAWRGSLRDHRQAIHTNDKRFECSDCGKKFAIKGGLRQHKRTCKGPKGPQPFSCIECGAGYTAQTSLRRHQLQVHGADPKDEDRNNVSKDHDEERDVDPVPSSSRRDISLSQFKPSKTADPNNRTFQCDSCGKNFTRNHQLLRHETFCSGSDVSESETEDADNADETVEAVSGKRF